MRGRRHGGRARGMLAVVGVALLTACGSGSGGGGPSTQTTAQVRPRSTAKLTLISPKDGEVFTSGTIPVKVSLQDAKIVPIISTNLKPNEGHLHLYLDNQIVSMNYQPTAVLHNVAPGQHLLRVEFVATDHAPFDPRVVVQITFTVKG